MKELKGRQRQRTDTAARWTSVNPVLLAGEIGYESDTGRFKFGNGSSAWSTLAYRGGIATVNGAAPDANGNVAVSGGGGGTTHHLMVRTQADFDAMIASPTWLDAHSVLLAGSFTYAITDGQALIVPASVCIIDGINGAKITATGNASYIMRYQTRPIDGGRRVSGLTLEGSGSTFGFGYMTGLYHCVVKKCNIGYHNCGDLTACTAYNCESGFDNCLDATSCFVRSTRSGINYGFSACKRLTSCRTSIERGLLCYGFSHSSYLCNCLASVVGTSTSVGYDTCSFCSCCTCDAMSANAVNWNNVTQKCTDTCV